MTDVEARRLAEEKARVKATLCGLDEEWRAHTRAGEDITSRSRDAARRAAELDMEETTISFLIGRDRGTVRRFLGKTDRPTARHSKENEPTTVNVGDRVTVPAYSVPDDWAREGEVQETNGETAFVLLDDGHGQELPTAELNPEDNA